MEGGEEEKGKNNMPKKSRQKKRSFLERAIEAMTGAFIVYISNSATVDLLRLILLIGGLVIIFYAILPD